MYNLSKFLQEKGISIPDNNTPDTPVATKVKHLLTTEFDRSPDAVVNEAELRRDLDMYDLECIDFLATWMNAFGLDYKLLNEVMGPDNEGMDIMFRIKTVGEIVALTEWLMQGKSFS